MESRLRSELRQTRPFVSLQQEAFLSVGRTWAILEHTLAETLRPHGITPTQYNVLRILRGAGKEGLCRAEVMERMVAQVPDATRLLDRLQGMKLIERERDASDRRFVRTRITAKGLELVSALDAPVQELHEEHFVELDEAELARLIELLGSVRATLCPGAGR